MSRIDDFTAALPGWTLDSVELLADDTLSLDAAVAADLIGGTRNRAAGRHMGLTARTLEGMFTRRGCTAAQAVVRVADALAELIVAGRVTAHASRYFLTAHAPRPAITRPRIRAGREAACTTA